MRRSAPDVAVPVSGRGREERGGGTAGARTSIAGRGRHDGPNPAQTGAADTEEEVRLVLEMLKEGKLSAEEATRLISALRR